MKNFYFISLLLISYFGISQNLLLNGDFEAWDDANTPTDWTKVENIDQESTDIHGGMYSAKHTGGTKDLGQTIAGIVEGNTYDISMWYRVDATGADGSDARIWSYWKDATDTNITDAATDGALRGPNNSYFDNNGNVWTEYTASVVAPVGATSLYFEVRTYGSAVVYWDDFSVECTTCGSDPSIVITDPMDGEVLPLATTEYTFNYVVNNFDVAANNDGVGGHIHAKLNGSPVGDYMYYTTDPITIPGLTEGTHTLRLELVDDNHAPLDPAIFDEVTFTIPTSTNVTDIAALRDAVEIDGLGGYYTIDGEVFVSYVVEDAGNGSGGRNQRYVQDASGEGLLLDDTDLILSSANDDGMTGLTVKVGEYSGVLQGVPQSDPGVSSSGNTVAPMTVALADYLADPEMYESVLIQLDGMTFDDAGGTFAADTNYNIGDGTSSVILRTIFDMSDMIGQSIPTTANVVCLGSEFNGTPQVAPRWLSDIEVLGVEDINQFEESIRISNTLVRDQFSIELDGKANVEIFNANGQLVQRLAGENRIQVEASSLSTGVYFVTISQDGNTVTKKIIKQ